MDSQQKNKLTAVVLAGGKGTRLSAVTNDIIPKPMVQLCGKPVLEHIVDRLRENGITEIYFMLGHLHEKIEEYFGNGSKFGVNISYVVESEPLGSAGALYYLKDKIKGDFLVCSGDTVFDINISRMFNYHKSKNALLTLYTHPNLHPYDSDLVVADKDGKVSAIDRKGNKRVNFYRNNVNAGFVIAHSSTLKYFSTVGKVNFEHQFVSHFIPQGRVYAYCGSEYIKDVGTPERLDGARIDIESGKVKSLNLSNKQRAIFLDRDGTINKYKGFITSAAEIELLDGVVEAVKLINDSRYLAVVISNQPVIARGEATFDDVEETFCKIDTLLGNNGAYLDGVFYCPHHPHGGYEGEIAELKIKCDCRKPNVGLIKAAAERFNLDVEKCFFVGDSNVDVLTAYNAGIPCVKLDRGVAEQDCDVKPKYRAPSLLKAVQIILKEDYK